MTVAVDPGIADWLKTGALFSVKEDEGANGKWPGVAIDTEIASALALKEDAVIEAQRQLTFVGGPLALEVHVVPGLRADIIGKAVTIIASGLGYEAGRDVFVIDAEEAETTEQTTLAVLRRLD